MPVFVFAQSPEEQKIFSNNAKLLTDTLENNLKKSIVSDEGIRYYIVKGEFDKLAKLSDERLLNSAYQGR